MAETPDGADGDPEIGPRIAPLPPQEWSPVMGEALAALRPPDARHPFPPRRDDRPKGLNVLGTLAQHPVLTRAYHTFNGHILFATTLSLRERELVVLRVAANRRSAYEWAQHTVMGADVGLTEAEIGRIVEGPDAEGWSDVDAATLRAVDELIAEATITDATWAALAGDFDDQRMMDLVFTVGAYDALAMALRSFRVDLDADLPVDDVVRGWAAP